MRPNVQKAEVAKAKSVQIAYCRLLQSYCRPLQSWIYWNEPEQNFISFLL